MRYSEKRLLIAAINIVAMGYGGCVRWTNNREQTLTVHMAIVRLNAKIGVTLDSRAASASLSPSLLIFTLSLRPLP